MRSTIIIMIFLLIVGCDEHTTIEMVTAPERTITLIKNIKPAKWYNNHNSAVTITYDASIGNVSRVMWACDEVMNRNMIMDLEMVTAKYDEPDNQHYLEYIREEVQPRGIGFFGHGHEHVNHDVLGYDGAYNSFKLCYDLMTEWGFIPKTYAYPHARGYYYSTQLACKNAGFIAARGYTLEESESYICPNSVPEPENWFYLPSIPFAEAYDNHVQNNEELLDYLDKNEELSSWIILLYHGIGLEEAYGYYPLEEFRKDLDEIKSRDIWCDHQDDICLYIMEKNKFQWELLDYTYSDNAAVASLKFSDGFDNYTYNQELTLNIELGKDTKFNYATIVNSDNFSKTVYIEDGKFSINILPDEKEHRLILTN